MRRIKGNYSSGIGKYGTELINLSIFPLLLMRRSFCVICRNVIINCRCPVIPDELMLIFSIKRWCMLVSHIDLNQIDNMQYDVLREIGNIGAGNATTALFR